MKSKRSSFGLHSVIGALSSHYRRYLVVEILVCSGRIRKKRQGESD